MSRVYLNRIRAVIFDLGETLYEPPTLGAGYYQYHLTMSRKLLGEDFYFPEEQYKKADAVAYEQVARRLVEEGVGPEYEITKQDWVEYDTAILKGFGVTGDLERLGRKYQDLWEAFEETYTPVLKPDTRGVLEGLSDRGYRLGLATNWSDPSEQLRKDGILDFFQSVQYSLVPGYSKPSPYMLFRNAQVLGLNPRMCAFVGNSIRVDIEAARRAEMLPILLLQVYHERPIDDGLIGIERLADLLDIFQ
ncbi:MAG: HAD family hydrolase [Candidatus Thorarchaeota archaeon]|nr:MAG: HAD family hydrolase [Candidatus Thorarchaeota archaeon]